MIQLSFRPQGDHAVAVIPATLPLSRQIALLFSHYGVPTLPGQPRGLLLCDEERYKAWVQALAAVQIREARRLCFLLHTQIEIRSNLHLRLPRALLAYAGIEHTAMLTFRPDGSILLTPPQAEEETP